MKHSYLVLISLLNVCLTLYGADTAGAEHLVFAHLCPWFNVQNQEHTARRDFPIAMGFGDVKNDPSLQIAWASQAGIDGFMVDCLNDEPGKRWTIRTFRRYQEVAENTSGFWVFPCLDRNGLYGADGLADFILEALKTKDSPAWLRINGKPVFWTYAAYSLPVQEWHKVLERVKAAGQDIFVVCEIGGWVRNLKPPKGMNPNRWLPEQDIIRWGRIGPLYSFAGDIEPLMTRVRTLLEKRHCPGARPTIGTLRPGYFSPRNGQWTPDHFTQRVREQFPRVQSLDIINITTWNDYAEDTHFEPSRNKLFCRLDLLHSLIATYKGKTWPSESKEMRWYLSAPWECYWQDEIEAEILGLVPPNTPPYHVKMVLLADGRHVAEHETWLMSGGVRAHQFTFKLSNLPKSRFAHIRVSVDQNGQSYLTWNSAPILLWPQLYHPSPTRCNIVTSPTFTLPTGPAITFEKQNGSVAKVMVDWKAAPDGARVHINQNGRLRRITSPAPAHWAYDPSKLYNPHRPRWERFQPVPQAQRWGFWQAGGITRDGRVGWGRPVWVEPKGDAAVCGVWSFEEDLSTIVNDASIYGHNGELRGNLKKMRCADGYRGRCIRFDGEKESIDLPGNISPPGPFTISMWIRPEGKGQGMLYADVAAPIIFYLDAGQILCLTRKSEDRWVSARGKTRIPLNKWTYVAATYDLKRLRVYVNGVEDGSAPCRGKRKSQRIAIGRNPYATGSNYFSGCIDEVKLEARCRPIAHGN